MALTATQTDRPTLPTMSVGDTVGVVAGVILPTFAKGAIIRRPGPVALAERLDLDRRAVRRVQRLRATYGAGPVLLKIPIRRQAILLAPGDVRRVLDGAPEPFSPASSEKRAALGHFEPGAVLYTRGPARPERRRFNELVLDMPLPAHRLAARFLTVVDGEAATMIADLGDRPLAWGDFHDTWYRIVRRVTFGDAARDDRAFSDLLDRLRSDGNWAFFKPRRQRLLDQFQARLRGHLARAEPGSLAATMAETPATADTAADLQVPHWLFAFDAASIAIFRALALLATHPAQANAAGAEVADHPGQARIDLPYLRACVLDALRLWPTTPAVLRQSTAATDWPTGTMPEGTGVLIFAPYFHRDDERLAEADRFAPELWTRERGPDDWPLIPFSGGPAICPARNLVLLLTSAFLAALIERRQVRLLPPRRLDPRRPLPGTLNHFALRFALDR